MRPLHAGIGESVDPPLAPSRYIVFGVLVVSALVFDLWTKSQVFHELGFPFRAGQWSWTGQWGGATFSLSLFTSFNRGALWGVGQGQEWFFSLVSLGACAFILYALFVRRAATSWWLTICLALIMAGALGNLWDRLYLHGCVGADGAPMFGVRDFIRADLPSLRYVPPVGFAFGPEWTWPIFNFADTFLVTGAIMLGLYSFMPVRPKTPPIAAPASPASPHQVNQPR